MKEIIHYAQYSWMIVLFFTFWLLTLWLLVSDFTVLRLYDSSSILRLLFISSSSFVRSLVGTLLWVNQQTTNDERTLRRQRAPYYKTMQIPHYKMDNKHRYHTHSVNYKRRTVWLVWNLPTKNSRICQRRTKAEAKEWSQIWNPDTVVKS